MRAAQVHRYGKVVVEEVDVPEPGPGEVRVRVHASSVNALDWYGVHGRPYVGRLMTGLRRPKSPRLGVDFAGVVEATGEEVYGCRDGAFAEYVVISDASAVAPKPPGVGFDEAAAVPIAGLTALQGLRDRGGVTAGKRVLVNGAAGGVGTFAVQIAAALGADVHAVCSTRNVEQTQSLGASRAFDYTREDFARSGERYDVLFDNAGSRSWRAMRRVLVPGGIAVLVGGSRSNRLLGPLGHVARVLLQSRLGSQRAAFFIAKPNRADLEALGKLLESGRVKAVVERRYPLEEIAQAVDALSDGHPRAKTVVTV